MAREGRNVDENGSFFGGRITITVPHFHHYPSASSLCRQLKFHVHSGLTSQSHNIGQFDDLKSNNSTIGAPIRNLLKLLDN